MRRKAVLALAFSGLAACVACGTAKSGQQADPGRGAAGMLGSSAGASGSVAQAGLGNVFGGDLGGGSASGSTAQAGMAGASQSAGSGGLGSAGSVAAPLFSDDFEAASIDPARWTPRINGGAQFELDTNERHGGKQSLHLKHMGFSSMLAVEGAPVFPAPNNTFYGRLWLRVAPSLDGGLPQGHVVWFEAGDVSNDTHEVRIGMNLGFFQSNLYYQGEVDLRDPSAKLMPNTWQCVQFELGSDVLEVSLDGVRSSVSTTDWVAAQSVNGNTSPKSAWSPSYAAFRIGWELGSGEIWYDDVALGYAPISCD